MTARLHLSALFALLAPGVAFAADCTQEHAVYADSQSGYEIRFRPGQPWEMGGMTTLIFDLHFPHDGHVLWGRIGSNMGISRDTGSVFWGCERPGPDDPGLTDEIVEQCRVWEGVVYSLGDGTADLLPDAEGGAADVLLFSDIGRVIRYSGLVDGPGDEPWDVFAFTGCAP